MKKLLISIAAVVAMSCGVSAHAQQCTSHIGASFTSSGNNLLIAAPADTAKNFHICAMYVRVVQGVTPTTFQVKACTDSTCATSVSLSPAWFGIASGTDKYDFQPGSNAQLQVPRGYGLYLVLASAPTSAQIQVVYGVY